jgi:hypothetical protein
VVNNEPVIVGYIVTILTTFITLLVSLNIIHLTPEDTATLTALVGSGVGLIASIWSRSKVVPTAKTMEVK